MCIFTHFAAGALVGGLTGNVYWGAAAGLASHAALDVIPHYDHPDWRLELGGGIASLVLLLLMPFASWPAVIGGLCGMLPDIENLLQKLGKMRRDQFVYPTHTGLLPHGRTLGARSIVWQFAILAGCYLLLGLFAPSSALAAAGEQPTMAQPVVRVLAADDRHTVLRVEFPVIRAPRDWQSVDPMQVHWALPPYADENSAVVDGVTELAPPRMGLSLAVPTRRAVDWSVRDVQWWKEPVTAVAPGALVEFSTPVVARSVPLTGTEVELAPAGGILRGVTIEVRHPATGVQQDYLAAAVDSDVFGKSGRSAGRPNVLNPELLAKLASGSREVALQKSARKAEVADLFALTRNWVKLSLTETGLYRVTGQELSNYGVSTSSVDPGKLRVFRGGGLPLAIDPETPDSTQVDRIGLNELAIEVVDGGDGEWNLDDEIRFYGVGTSAWLDRFDPAGERLEFYDHPYAAEAAYWITWEDDVTVSPLPGAPQRVATVSAPPTGGVRQQTARIREHFEEQFLDARGVVQDNWLWDNSIFSSRIEQFELRAPVSGATARFQIDVRGIYSNFDRFVFNAVAYLNADQANQATLDISYTGQSDSMRVRIVGDSSDVLTGTNTITLSNNSTDRPLRPLALDSFDILYWTSLDLAAAPGQLAFAHWGDQVAAPGTAVDLEIGSAGAQAPMLWDVTDPQRPGIMQGSAASGSTYIFGVNRNPDSDRHFVATMPGDFLTAPNGSRVFPVSLRSRGVDLDYLVVCAQAFSIPAGELAQYRAGTLPGVTSPAAGVATVEDIYDNFSGGQKDVRAIRNYLKWVYDLSGHRLKYVCFLGNASRDYRNYRERTPLVDLYDLVSTELRTSFPITPTALSIRLAYSSDDGLVSFDSPPAADDFDFPDLACGRLPALDRDEAQDMVDRAIAFSRDPVPGPWRNRIMMTADDGVRPSSYPDPKSNEFIHLWEAEQISNGYLPVSVDLVKVYAADYDFPPGSVVKPTVRADINANLNRGVAIYYYVGHGSEDNLADEQIFQSRDISNLTNGMMRGVFAAFSCDVGVFDSPSRRSMAEQFLQYESGGTIGAVCAAEVSFISYNNTLTNAFFGHLFPARNVDPDVTVAEALRLAKSDMTITWRYRTNSQRYNFFGDPAMSLPLPADDLALAPTSVDTLRTGARQTVVLGATGKTLLGTGDTYRLRVEESAVSRRIPYHVFRVNGEVVSQTDSSFVDPGSSIFVGTGTLGAGEHTVPFKVPVQFQYGPDARVRMIVETPEGDHVAAEQLPAVRAVVPPNDDIVGPVIALGFESNTYRVQPGATLNAAVSDTSGVAMLGTNPGNSLLLEFDDTGIMTDVTGSFAYDADSYTSGRVSFTLPRDLPAGRHLAALHASDMLGNVGSDTLSFEIGDTGQGSIGTVTLFPNPTAGYCRLLFELGDPMDVQWDIYSLAGSRIRTIKGSFGAGPQVLEWDGRDGRNDEIANGTYIYVLRGLGAGAGDRDIRKTGKLVIMR